MGYIDDLRVYGRVLSASSVQAQVFAKLNPKEEVALVGYYTFDLGSQPGLAFAKYACAPPVITIPSSACSVILAQARFCVNASLPCLLRGIKS